LIAPKRFGASGLSGAISEVGGTPMVICIDCFEEFEKILHRRGVNGMKPALQANRGPRESDDEGPNDDPPAALRMAA
jgi:hypothetical protein